MEKATSATHSQTHPRPDTEGALSPRSRPTTTTTTTIGLFGRRRPALAPLAPFVLSVLCLAGSACTLRTSSSSGEGGQGGEGAQGGQGGSGAGSTTASEGGGGDAGSGGGTGGTGGAGGEGGGPVGCAPGRTTEDRPDDHDGYQIRVNYVLPLDGSDERLDVSGKLQTSVAAWSKWFASQAGGRTLRLDTCGGALDVRFVQLDKTEAALKAEGVYLRDAIEEGLAEKGLIHPTKLEAVYYGGDADNTCGGGAWPPLLVGHVGAMYLKGTFTDPGIPPCGSNPVGASPDSPGYIEMGMLHEVVHTLGMVPSCAPHQTLSGHTSDDPTDLMYAGDEPWSPSVLDSGNDDYFDHGMPGCLDLAKSVFIEPLPADALPPPGW